MQSREGKKATSNLIHNKVFACVDCNYKTDKKSKLCHHMMRHSERKLFECSEPDCKYETNVKSDLKIHALNHSGVKLFQCKKCSYKTNKKHSLVSHSLIHCTEKVFKCAKCDYETNRRNCLESHIRNHAEDKLFNCSECKYGTNRKADLKKHQLVHGKSAKLYKCSECDFEVFSTILFSNHIRTHSNIDSNTDPGNELDTDMLSASELKITSIKSLRLRSDKRLKKHKCPQCTYETNRKSNLNVHLLTHSKSFLCPECDANYFAGLSEVHLLSKSEKDTFICFECPYETSQKKNLKSHLFTHGKVSLRLCDVCNRDFFVKGNETQSDEMFDMKNFNSSLNRNCKKEYETSSSKVSLSSSLKKESAEINMEIDTETSLCKEINLSETESSLDKESIELETKSPLKNIEANDEERQKMGNNHTNLQTFQSFRCSKCEYTTKKMVNLNRHLHIHKRELEKLNDTDANMNAYINLLTFNKHEKLFSCSKCTYKTHKRSKLNSHCAVHLDEKLFKCAREGCKYETNVRSDLRVHELNHSGIRLFKCLQCDYETNKKHSLKSHSLVHLTEKTLKCTQCDYVTNRRSCLENHKRNHSDSKSYKCSECSYGTNRKADMKKHYQTHNTEEFFQCSECDFRVVGKRLFNIHLLIHSNTKSYSCTQCSFQTDSKRNLKAHTLNHSNIKVLKCSICPYSTNYTSNFKLHVQSHEADKLHKCPHCSYGTHRKANLSIHILTHSKPFQCPDCDILFALTNTSEVHMLRSAEKGSFTCLICSYETNRKGNLRSHLLTHSNTSLQKCFGCKREFFVKEMIPLTDRELSVDEPADKELCANGPDDLSDNESSIEEPEILSEKESNMTDYETLLREGFQEANCGNPSDRKNFDTKNDVDKESTTRANRNSFINKSKTSIDNDNTIIDYSSDRESTMTETYTSSEEACIEKLKINYKDFIRKSVWSIEDNYEGN